MTPDEFLILLATFNASLFNLFTQIARTRGISLEQLSQQDVDQLLISAGYPELQQEYIGSFNNLFAEQERIFNRNIVQSVENQLQLIRDANVRYLLGSAEAHAELLRRNLMDGIANGTPLNQTLENLREIPLDSRQLQTTITTGYANFQRSTTALTYESEPEQRFEYVGGVIPTSSCQCKWLIQNQRPEGYTKKEIDKGIKTECFDKKGNQLIINWWGRTPNFNCIHQWLPIISQD